MSFLLGILNGFQEIWAHKFRSLLSMSGIILGVAALVGMVGLVQGMVQGFKVFFESTGGLEKLEIEPREAPEHQRDQAHISPGMTINDLYAIQKAVPLARFSAGQVSLGWERISYKDRRMRSRVNGTNPEIQFVDKYDVSRGRFLSDMDLANSAMVTVIGAEVKRRLFGREDAIGKKIKINDRTFTVIGVTGEEQANAGNTGWNLLWWKNRNVFIPITTAMQRFTGNDQLRHLNVQVYDTTYLTDVVEQINNTLRVTHRGIEDFEVRTRTEEMEEFKKQERSFTLTLGGVAAISLFVGGIGIMNVMLAVINERIREIGVRKAVGARGIDIFIQFLAESLVISVLGGFIGIVVSIGLIEGMRALLEGGEANVMIIVSPMAMVAGFAFSAGIGLLAGIYPAIKAARLDVIEALRYE